MSAESCDGDAVLSSSSSITVTPWNQKKVDEFGVPYAVISPEQIKEIAEMTVAIVLEKMRKVVGRNPIGDYVAIEVDEDGYARYPDSLPESIAARVLEKMTETP